MKEDDLIADIGKVCDRLGLWWVHFPVVYYGRRDIQGCHGFPDLLIMGRNGLLFRECKMPGNTLRPNQELWRNALLATGRDWAVWYPEDLRSGQIETELAAIA